MTAPIVATRQLMAGLPYAVDPAAAYLPAPINGDQLLNIVAPLDGSTPSFNLMTFGDSLTVLGNLSKQYGIVVATLFDAQTFAGMTLAVSAASPDTASPPAVEAANAITYLSFSTDDYLIPSGAGNQPFVRSFDNDYNVFDFKYAAADDTSDIARDQRAPIYWNGIIARDNANLHAIKRGTQNEICRSIIRADQFEKDIGYAPWTAADDVRVSTIHYFDFGNPSGSWIFRMSDAGTIPRTIISGITQWLDLRFNNGFAAWEIVAEGGATTTIEPGFLASTPIPIDNFWTGATRYHDNEGGLQHLGHPSNGLYDAELANAANVVIAARMTASQWNGTHAADDQEMWNWFANSIAIYDQGVQRPGAHFVFHGINSADVPQAFETETPGTAASPNKTQSTDTIASAVRAAVRDRTRPTIHMVFYAGENKTYAVLRGHYDRIISEARSLEGHAKADLDDSHVLLVGPYLHTINGISGIAATRAQIEVVNQAMFDSVQAAADPKVHFGSLYTATGGRNMGEATAANQAFMVAMGHALAALATLGNWLDGSGTPGTLGLHFNTMSGFSKAEALDTRKFSAAMLVRSLLTPTEASSGGAPRLNVPSRRAVIAGVA